MNHIEHLKEAKRLITDEANWCKGERAKNSDNVAVPVMSDSATQYCSKGALLRVAGSEDADISKLEKFFTEKNAGNPLSLNYVGFNELKTHPEVLAMWDAAIANARASRGTFR